MKEYQLRALVAVIGLFVLHALWMDNRIDRLEVKLAAYDVENDSTQVTEAKEGLPEHFDYVYKRFKVYNPEIDSNTVITFNKVCEEYKLDTTKQLLDWCVGQILLESGAQQYYKTNHPKEGQLVKSSAGAIGMCQIMPKTAYGYITKYVEDGEAAVMYQMGASEIAFTGKGLKRKQQIAMAKSWIENQTNNIVLWGYIMRSKLDKRPSILKALVAYNAGTGGMITFMNKGGNLYEHDYIRGILTKLNYVAKKV